MVLNGSLTMLDMIQKDNDFLMYNFFTKLDDWKNEHEYRMVALIDNKGEPACRLQIDNVSSCLEGVVLGEQIEPAYEETIKILVRTIGNNCEVKKIQFNSRMCKLV